MECFAELGYAGLLLSSFLAATILPLSSEVVLGILLLSGLNPVVLVGLATLGNVAGALVNYALGFWGGLFLGRKVSRVSAVELEKAERRFRKYGVISLLFAWVPVVGDPLTVVAGVLKVDMRVFLFLVASGKLIRYVVIACLMLNCSLGSG